MRLAAMKGFVLGSALAAAVTVASCAPPPVQLIPPIGIRVDASFPCRDADTTASTDPDRCVFWRTAAGRVYYGPARMVHLPPAGTDEIIRPPYLP
jgi:hypothetical protein